MIDNEPLILPRYARATALVAAALYLIFSMHLPVVVLGTAGHDDAWFFLRARDMASGHWLGAYSQMTLMKGPGYVFFLALDYVLGLPVTLLKAAFYAGACALLGQAVFRLSRSAPLALAVFLVTLWHPALFTYRLIRDDIYGAQSLLYFACLAQALLIESRRRTAWAVAAGASLAWIWMTREEGVWLLAPTALVAAAAIWRERARLRPAALLVGVAVLGWGAVATCNLLAYRTFTVVDFKGRPYAQAVAALQGVRVGDPVAYVPVPRKVRERLYAVSPAFASLKPYFDGEGQKWLAPGCAIYPSTCGDIAGGWFVWALRDAVAWAGHYDRAAHANAFYDRLTREVRAGCRTGGLRCVGGLAGFMPPVTPMQSRQIPAKIVTLVRMVLMLDAPAPPYTSDGTVQQLHAMWEFEGYPRRTVAASDRVTLTGWFHGAPGAWIQLRCTRDGRDSVRAVDHAPSPDLVGFFKDPSAGQQRFTVDFALSEACRLQTVDDGSPDGGLGMTQLVPHADQSLAGGVLYIESGLGSDPGDALAIGIQKRLDQVYGVLVPLAALGAIVAYGVQAYRLARGSARTTPAWWLAHALWLGVFGRLAILFLVDISAFPGISFSYVSATLPLFCAAALMTIHLPFEGRTAKPPG